MQLPVLASVGSFTWSIQLNDHLYITLRFAKVGLLLLFGNWILIWNLQIEDKLPIWVENSSLGSDLEPKSGKFSPNLGNSQ